MGRLLEIHAAATMAEVGGGVRTDETKALGKAEEGLNMGEVGIVVGGGGGRRDPAHATLQRPEAVPRACLHTR